MISELEPSIYRSPTSNGEDVEMDLKMRIKYFEEMNKEARASANAPVERERQGFVKSAISGIEEGSPIMRRAEVIVEENYPQSEAAVKRYEQVANVKRYEAGNKQAESSSKRYEGLIEEEIVSTDADSMSSFDFVDFEMKLNEKIKEIEENDDAKSDEPANKACGETGNATASANEAFAASSHQEMPGRESIVAEDEASCPRRMDPKATKEQGVSKMVSFFNNQVEVKQISASDSPVLPKSSEIISDFENFATRPFLLKCRRFSAESTGRASVWSSENSMTSSTSSPDDIPYQIGGAGSALMVVSNKNVTTNINGEEVLLFSRKHKMHAPTTFRAPGKILCGKPEVAVSNRIISEDGILTYFKVFLNNSSWHVLKKADMKSVSELEDPEFYSFISSDIVTTIHLRSSFLIYDSMIVAVKILGKALCICQETACLRVVRLEKNLRAVGERSFTVSRTVFECSCGTERDEWVSMLEKIC